MNILFNISNALHGKKPRVIDVCLTYCIGSLVGVFLIFNYGQELSLIKKLVVYSVFLDVVGGVISNISFSTNDYYFSKSSKFRMGVIMAHIIQPLIIVFTLNRNVTVYFWFMYIYMFLSCLIVTYFYRNNSKTIALALLVIGIILSDLIITENRILFWFSNVFFFKMIFSFSVNHYKEQIN